MAAVAAQAAAVAGNVPGPASVGGIAPAISELNISILYYWIFRILCFQHVWLDSCHRQYYNYY